MVAVMEPIIMILRRELNLSRAIASLLTGCLVFLVIWILPLFESITDLVSRLIDSGVLATMLLLGLFVGWQLPRPVVRGEMYREPPWLFVVWWYLLRFVVPPVLTVILCIHIFTV